MSSRRWVTEPAGSRNLPIRSVTQPAQSQLCAGQKCEAAVATLPPTNPAPATRCGATNTARLSGQSQPGAARRCRPPAPVAPSLALPPPGRVGPYRSPLRRLSPFTTTVPRATPCV
jgi:hypothetical protein